MVDYSRWDNIDCSSDEEDASKDAAATAAQRQLAQLHLQQQQSEPQQQQQGGVKVGGGREGLQRIQPSKKGKEGRIKFEFEGREIYEWEQSLEEINLYVKPPPGVTSDMIHCDISHKHLTLGIKGNPPFINEDTWGPVKVSESYWMIDGGELNVILQKAVKGSTWAGALAGGAQAVDPLTREDMQKKLMLERFQEENPGFDFSQAEFNGSVPDPTKFMGGIKYT